MWEALSIPYICSHIVFINSNRLSLMIKKVFLQYQDLKFKKGGYL